MPDKNNKPQNDGKINGLIVLLVFLLGISSFLAIKYYNISQKLPSKSIQNRDITSKDILENTFTNLKHSYSFNYPKEWYLANCKYIYGGSEDIKPEEEDFVEFHREGWNCPPTDAPWGYMDVFVTSDVGQAMPTYDNSFQSLEPKIDKTINGNTYKIYWIVNNEPSPAPQKYQYILWREDDLLYIFTVYDIDDIQKLEKTLSTLKFN